MEPNSSKPPLQNLYESVGSWHGTGRYKYEGKEVVDILKGILTAGALIPFDDLWDQKRLDTRSISAARSRDYARLYASLFFPIKQRSMRELWNRLLWCCRYFLSSKWVAWNEYLPPRPHIIDYKNKVASWTAKLSCKSQSFFYLFLWGGTDIASNYPILIGIRRGAYITTLGSRFIDLHENRSATPISITDFTHIEVPQEHISETQQMFEVAGYSIPIIAIEVGDRSLLYF
jgi:hypothetical protein